MSRQFIELLDDVQRLPLVRPRHPRNTPTTISKCVLYNNIIIIIIIIIIIDYSHMPTRHKKEKEKGDIKSYEHDKFTSRSSKGDTTPNTDE